MTIGPITAESRGCYTAAVGNYPLGATAYLVSAKVDTTHYVEVQIDGYRKTTPVIWPKDGDSIAKFSIEIPNDGRSHTVQIVDTGRLGTTAAASTSVTLTSACPGVLKAEVVETIPNPTTREKYVTVKVSHDGETSGTFTGRLLMDGKVSGPEITLSNGDYQPRTITIPADGGKHLIEAETRLNDGWLGATAFLWFVVQADSLGGGPLPISQETSQFFPGDTVIIQAIDDARPLATDGSEWVKLDYAPKDTTGLWKPVGDGLFRPDEEGFWFATLKTNPTDFPAGSQWAIAVRKVRKHQPTYGTLNHFTMIAGPPDPVPPLAAPIIAGPLNHNQRASTWMELFGTGLPGSDLIFEVTRVTEWGNATQVPQRTTVKRDGTWRTHVYSEQSTKPLPYKILRYRAKAVMGGQESPFSNSLDVTWHYPLR
ncbi:hypothetical protein SAMN05216275_10568 [Streptosporangium canum]|uniref:Uncharacterized protein n=1 Tax=Streptosporangium canum TaxID=324952 RepID=A0A1I3LAQ4_9ACTN|nr:hypothetical protein [Streptosporangium canum]SFI81640.1 hypothetical protein SAMN05216275_10568 [Streptosporangium canum]